MEPYATIAAKWWANTLRDIDSRITPTYDMEMRKHIALNCKPCDKAINTFEKLLAEAILKEVKEHKTFFATTFDGSKNLLLTIATQAGVDIACLPVEASMRIRKNLVIVSSLDYQLNMEVLF